MPLNKKPTNQPTNLNNLCAYLYSTIWRKNKELTFLNIPGLFNKVGEWGGELKVMFVMAKIC